LIDEDILKQAKAKIWRDMSLALGNDEKDIIEDVYQNFEPRDPKDATFLSLLKGIYVIEYMNDDLWYDVHPIVAEGLNLNETD
jgi:Fe-S-cluster formation regulator IscX/YfhJ